MFTDHCYQCRAREAARREKDLVAYTHKRVKAVMKALPKEEWLACRVAVVNEIHAWLIMREMDEYRSFLTANKVDQGFRNVRGGIHSLVAALFEVEDAISLHLY